MSLKSDGEVTSAILSALSLLTKPLSDPSRDRAPSSQKEALLCALRANRALLLERLHGDKSFEELRRLREDVVDGVTWFSNTEDQAWTFVQECLLLLLTLRRHLSAQLAAFNASAPAPSQARSSDAAPPLSPDVLSVSQQKTLGATLQFVVHLGLCPYLQPGVGVPLGRRSAFGGTVEAAVGGEALLARDRRLFTTTNVLLELTELPSLATQVFVPHFGDILAALCQLGHQPQKTEEMGKLSGEERQGCREKLQSVLNKVYQPVVVKQLLLLQGPLEESSPAGRPRSARSSPSWLRRLCGRLLSERLMKPNGTLAVVRTVLEGGAGEKSDWRKWNCLARILVTCPQQSASADSYYKHVCPQILDLLHCSVKQYAQQFQYVATRVVHSLLESQPDFAEKYLLAPLLAPLHECAHPHERSTQVSVEEADLTRCVEDVLKVWVVANDPSVALLTRLEEVIVVIFALFCFSKQSVSFLRGSCQEILLWFFLHSEKSHAMSVLKQLSGLDNPLNQVDPEFIFRPGSDGGARLAPRDCSHEDDVLYEKLEGEQWRLECLMQLLAEMKDSDLPGDFFLELLWGLTSLVTATEEEEAKLDVSTMTLLEVEQQVLGRTAKHGRTLALLQVLAVMCELLPHSVLLGKTAQVVDFMVSLLQRVCVGLDHAGVLGGVNPIESQTVIMALSLLATMLSAPQLCSEDYSSMWRLLPTLETLSQKHTDVMVQDLAANIRSTIATHGACQSATLTNRTADRTLDNNNIQPLKEQRTQTLVRDPTLGCQRFSPNTTCPAHLDAHISRPDPQKQLSGESGGAGGQQSSGVLDSASVAFGDLLLDACAPDVPARAFALRTLTQMVQDKNTEALKSQEKVFMLFMENLEHEDSFIYLSAIQGLAVMADSYPEKILERLLEDFRNGRPVPTADVDQALETRLKLGEVLMRTSRALGELAPHYGLPLVSTFLQAAKDPAAAVRVSSLSNLGELLHRLDYAFGALAQEVSSCLSALLRTEKEAEVRRAAVHVVVQLLRGLGDKTTQVLQDVLLDLYRALKFVLRSDPDDVSVLHAQLALEELDGVMRKSLFPKQKLEKKIVVLP